MLSGRERATSCFVGRAPELGALRSALTSDHSSAGIAVVEGEAGIGKTALIDEALRRADVRSPWRESADEMGSRRPFGLLLDALRHGPGTAPRRQAVLAMIDASDSGGSVAAGLPFRVGEAVSDLIEEASPAGPVVAVFEDLHWVDPASLVALHRMVRAADRRSLQVVVSLRPGRRSAELEGLLSGLLDLGATHVRLGPLPEREWEPLVTATLDAPPGDSVMRRVADAGGNPLFIVELLAALRAEGALGLDEHGRATVASDVRLPSLAAAILAELRFLDADTLHVLRLAAALGAAFSMRELMELTERSAVSLEPGLHQAVSTGVLQTSEDRFAFRHEMIRSALYHDIPSPLREAVQAAAARALARTGAPATRVAAHLLLGATPGDPEAVGWLVRAATEAAAQSPAVAVECSERALALASPTDPRRSEISALRAVSLMRAGRIGDGERACRRALERPLPAGTEATLRFCLAQASLTRGDLDGAWEEVEAAVASPGLTGVERARMSAWASLLPLTAGALDDAEAAATRAEVDAVAAADLPAQVRALTTAAHVACTRSQQAHAASLASRAVAVAEQDGTLASYESVPDLVEALVLVDGDRVADAADAVLRGRQAAERFGDQSGVMFAQLVSAYGPFVTGDWEDALADVETGVALAVEIGAGAALLSSLAMAAVISLSREGPDAAESWLSRAVEGPAGLGYRHVWLHWARSACLQGRGRATEAFETLLLGWEQCHKGGMAFEYRVLGPPLCALAAACGADGLAGEVAAAVAGVAGANPAVVSLQGAALRSQGLATGDPEVLLEAWRTYGRSPRRPEQAASGVDAAVALAAQGRTIDATAVAHEALGLWDAMGARWEASRARARLRDRGLRLAGRAPRARAAEGWAALSPTERAVADLVAQRLSNPQIAERMFISRRTVETHVSHILAKLGLTGRAELFRLPPQHPEDGTR